MKRHIAFWVSAMMTVNLFTAVPAFATDDFSDVEVAVQEDSNEDAEEMEIQDSTEEDFEDEDAVTEDRAASDSEVDSVTDVDLFSDGDSENAVAESQQLKDAPTAEAEQESGFGSDYQKLLFSDGTYAGGVSQILVNGNVWEKVSSKYSLFIANFISNFRLSA